MKILRHLMNLAIAPIAMLLGCQGNHALKDKYSVVIDYSNPWTGDGAYFGCNQNNDGSVKCVKFSQKELKPLETALYRYVEPKLVDKLKKWAENNGRVPISAGPMRAILWENKSKPLMLTWSDDFYWRTQNGFRYEGVWFLSNMVFENVASNAQTAQLVSSQYCSTIATALIGQINTNLPVNRQLNSQFECTYQLDGPFPGVNLLHKISIEWHGVQNLTNKANLESYDGIYWHWIPKGDTIMGRPQHWWQNY